MEEWYADKIFQDISKAPLTFQWKGLDAHIGPVEKDTPLLRSLKNKTTNGTVALAAAVATWGFLRFDEHTDISTYLKFSEAAFLQMPNPEMIDLSTVKQPVPSKPKMESALLRLQKLLKDAVNPVRWGDTIDQPFRETFHLVHLTRHVLDANTQKRFDLWLSDAIANIDEIAKRPKEDKSQDWASASEKQLQAYIKLFRGQDIPPQVFVNKIDTKQLKKTYASFATKQRLRDNKFIHK